MSATNGATLDLEPFMAVISAIGPETGLRLWRVKPGAPEYSFALGPFPALLRVGFDLDPSAGLVPEVVLDIEIGDAQDRWEVFAAWERAPVAAMAGHGLPRPLPRPDLAFGAGAATGVAYRVPLQAFGIGTALQLLHAGAAFASFMGRDLAPHLPDRDRARLARHGVAPGSPVPLPSDLMAGRAAHEPGTQPRSWPRIRLGQLSPGDPAAGDNDARHGRPPETSRQAAAPAEAGHIAVGCSGAAGSAFLP